MKKSIGFVSLFLAFVITSSMSVYFFNNYLKENADEVVASVVSSDLPSPSPTKCDPFCIVEPVEKSNEVIFEDVDFSHKNALAISVIHDFGLIKGYSDGTFKPENKLNRAELLAITLDALDADLSGQVLESCFKDVKDEWYSAYVCYAKNNGIVSGYSDGYFRPGNPVNRAEALKITLLAFGYDISQVPEDMGVSYLDVESSHWILPYLYLGGNDSIVSKDGRFVPSADITRAEFVQLIYNTMQNLDLLQ